MQETYKGVSVETTKVFDCMSVEVQHKMGCLFRLLQVWQQQNKAHWYDNPLIAQDASMLSKECIDLLNRMFHLDEEQR
jgi:hypothetical protein